MEMALEQLHFGPGPLSLAQLETFDKFEVESISFKCTPPHGVVQSETRRNRFSMPTAPLLDYFANLSMPSLDSSTPQPMDSVSSASGSTGASSQILFGASPSIPLSASPSLAPGVFGDYKFELDLERKQHVDSLELEIELNRDWLPMDDDPSLLAPTYSISVQYLRKVKSSTASVLRESGTTSNPSLTIGSPTPSSTSEYAWLTALDRFDLSSGIIRGAYGPETIPKLRIGSLALPNVSTKRLQVSLHITPPSPTIPSLSTSLSGDVGASGLLSPSPSFSPQSSLVTPPPVSSSSTPIPVLQPFSATGSLSGSQTTYTALNYGRSAKKQSTVKTFAYSHDFDENGLIYWLGTKDATNPGVWKNPAETGDLFLQISHGKMHKPEMKVWDIIGRKGTSATYWGGSTPQWFLIDLGPDQQLMPTVYTLRHGYQHANSFLQNWIFEGSNDCLTWTHLHEGAETPFSSGFESKSFTVKLPEITSTKVSDAKDMQDGIASSTSKSSLATEPSLAQTHFRYFRVLQKGNYSMGIGKTGGTPFMCLAGFEVYGELLIHPSATVPLPNVVSSIAFQLSTLKPSHGMSLQQTRLHRRAISESTELHSAILATCCEWRTAPSLRHLCIDMAMDVWRRRVPQTTALVTRMDLRAFLRRNLVKAGKITAQKAARFLLCCLNASQETEPAPQPTPSTLGVVGSQTGRTGSLPERLSSASRLLPPSVAPSGSLLNISPSSTIVTPPISISPLGPGLKLDKPEPTLKEKLLDALLDMMPDIVDLVDNKHGFNHIMILLVSCWDANPEKAHTSLASAVSLLGTKLNDNRSPFYNLLRTHFGLYGFPLELDIFVPLRELELMEQPPEANLPSITNPLATPHEPALPPQIASSVPTSGISTPVPSATPTGTLTAATANSSNASSPSSATNVAPTLDSTGTHVVQTPSQGDVSGTAQVVVPGSQVPQSLSPTPTTGTHGTITMHATTVMPTTTSSIGPLLAMSETKKLLEQQLLQSTHDFGIKRRALTTLLEEITIAGDSYANHDRSVLAAYDDCISAQMHYHRVFKKLKKLSPTTHDGNFEEEDDFDDDSSDSEAEEDSDDEEDDEDHVKLTRWTFIVESLLSLLNKSSVDVEHTDEEYYDLFSHLVIFGTPLVRKEAIIYLSSHLNTTVPFPATILRNWFSKDTDLSRLMNLFPQQIVFDALQEIMVQDRVRFFYVDGLFSLLEKEISLHQFEMHHYLSNNGNNMPSPGGTNGGPPGAGDMPSSPRNPPSSYAQLFVRSDSTSAKNGAHLSSSPDGNFGTTDFEIDESAIDVPLVSWLLLLLSNTMHRVSDNAPVHKGSKCRNCNMSPICGVRFRCVNCVDYDLCEACESDAASRHNKLHVFLKIPAALPLPPSSFHGLPPPKEPLLPLLYKKHSMSALDSSGMPSSSSINALTLNHGNLASNFGHSTYAHSGIHAPSHGHMPTAPLGAQGLLHSPFSNADAKSPLVGSGPISSSGTGGGVSTSFFLSIMNQQKTDLQLAGLDSTSIAGPHGGYMKATPEVGPAFMGPNFSSSLTSHGTPVFPHGGSHLSSNVHPLAQAQQMGQPPLLQPKPLYPTGGVPSLIGLTPKSAGNETKPKSKGSAGVPEIHRGVTCDGCGKVNFEGARFKCVHCDEFNLCDSCEGNVEHYPLHLFLKVRKPLPSRSYRSHTKGIYNTHDDVDLGKALIPVLLHHAFYPASSYKSHNPPGATPSPSRIKFSKSVTDMMSFSREEQENQFGLTSVPTGTISLRSSLIDLTSDDNATIGPTPHGGRARAGSLSGPSPASLGRDLSSHPSESGSTKVEPDIPGDGEGREQVFDGRHLRSIFGVIMLSARLQTLGPELFLLAMRVLEGLTTQYTPDDIAADVFNHPRFDDFLRQVASYPSSFIRSAVLQMVDKLVNSAAYIVGKEGAHALKRIRTLLRNKAIKLLRESESAPNTASVHSSDNFLLELLLVVTSDKDIIKSESHTGNHDSADFIPSPSSKRKSRRQSVPSRSALSPASAQRAKENRRSKYSSARVPSPSSQGLGASNSSKSKKKLRGDSLSAASPAAHRLSPNSRSPSIDKPLLDAHASPRTLAPPEGSGGLRARNSSRGTKKHKKKHSSSKPKSDHHRSKESSQRDKPSKNSKNGAHKSSRKRRESVLQGGSTNLIVPAQNTADDDQYPLDSIANYLVQFLADGDDMPLGSNTAARTWCMVFRLLRFADPQHVGRIPQLTRAIRQAMTAPEELQVLLVDDFVELLSILVSKPGLGSLLQSSILGEISKAFVEAYYEDNTLAFSRVISVMFENFNADVEFDLADVSSLLQVLADSLPESLPAFFPKDDPGNRLIKQIVDYLILIFSSSVMTEQHVTHIIEVAIGQRDKAFSQLVITWLSLIEPKSKQKATAALRRDDASIKSYSSSAATNSAMFSGTATPLQPMSSASNAPTPATAPQDAPIKNNSVTIFDLGRSFTRLIKVMCHNSSSDSAAKHFLALALASLRSKANSVVLAELCLSLIKTEDLAYYFLIELEGFDFFEDQIKNANTKFRSSFLAPAFASMLSATITTKTGPNTNYGGMNGRTNYSIVAGNRSGSLTANRKFAPSPATPFGKKPNKSNLENLSAVAELLYPRGDRQLERLLKESSTQTSAIWMHNYKARSATAASYASSVEDRVTFDMSIPDNVILREIRLDCVANHNGSKFPTYVTIETGTSLSRLLPVGRFSCKQDGSAQSYASNSSQTYSSNMKHSATFKFPLPDIEVVKFVRIHIQRPKQSNWIALSRLQLLGHSSLLYNVGSVDSLNFGTGDGATPTLVHQLPITNCLDILEHAIGFPRVNYALAIQKNTTPQFGINLLYTLSKQTFTSIQSIVSNLAQNDPSLSDFLLDQLLEGQTVYHASLAGKVCALADSQTGARLNKLRDFVFQQIDAHTSTSLSSHLVPFLDALSDAISSNIREYNEAKCVVSQSDVKLLFQVSITALDGSLLQQGSLRLLSSLIQSDPFTFDVILEYFSHILKETLETIAQNQSEAITLAVPSASSGVPSIVVSQANISSTASPTLSTATQSQDDSTAKKASDSGLPKGPHAGAQLDIPAVNTHNDIFQLFVDKNVQIIISTIGLLASSSPLSALSLLRSGLPERIIQTVKTILTIREEKQQQKQLASVGGASSTSGLSGSSIVPNLGGLGASSPNLGLRATDASANDPSTTSRMQDPMRPRGEILTLQRILEASLAFLSNMAHENALKSWLGEHAFDLLFDLLKREHGSSLMYAAQQVFRASANLHAQNQSRIAGYVLKQLQTKQDALTTSLNALPPVPKSTVEPETKDSLATKIAAPVPTTATAAHAATPATAYSPIDPALRGGFSTPPPSTPAQNAQVVEELLGYSGHSVLSEATVQQLVDMFSIEDKVVLSLHPKNGAEDEVKALGPQTLAPGSLYAPTRQETIKMDKAACNANLDLEDEGLTVIANSSTATGWRTVLSTRPITSGVRRWEVVLDRVTSTANVMIGVCEKGHKLNAYLGQNYTGSSSSSTSSGGSHHSHGSSASHHPSGSGGAIGGGHKGWSYYGATTGFTYHDGKSDSRYGQKMVQGDVIGVILDLNEGTLSFTRNGEDLGIAFKDIASRELYPAVSLYDAGDRVRFQPLEGAPVDKGPLSKARIEGISPLIYQRSGPLFALHTSIALKEIAESLIGTASTSSNKVVIFEFILKPSSASDDTQSVIHGAFSFGHASSSHLGSASPYGPPFGGATPGHPIHSVGPSSVAAHPSHGPLSVPSYASSAPSTATGPHHLFGGHAEEDDGPSRFLSSAISVATGRSEHGSVMGRAITSPLVAVWDHEETLGSVLSRFGGDCEILDIYFEIVPRAEAAIRQFADTYQPRCDMEDDDMDERLDGLPISPSQNMRNSVHDDLLNEHLLYSSDLDNDSHSDIGFKSKSRRPGRRNHDLSVSSASSVDGHEDGSVSGANEHSAVAMSSVLFTSSAKMVEKRDEAVVTLHKASTRGSVLHKFSELSGLQVLVKYLGSQIAMLEHLERSLAKLNVPVLLSASHSDRSGSLGLSQTSTSMLSGTGTAGILPSHGVAFSSVSGHPVGTNPLATSPHLGAVAHGSVGMGSTGHQVTTSISQANKQVFSGASYSPASDLLKMAGISINPHSVTTVMSGQSGPALVNKQMMSMPKPISPMSQGVVGGMSGTGPVGVNIGVGGAVSAMATPSKKSSSLAAAGSAAQFSALLSKPSYSSSVPLATWKNWLELLELELSVKNFALLFLHSTECRSLLFKVLSDLQLDMRRRFEYLNALKAATIPTTVPTATPVSAVPSAIITPYASSSQAMPIVGSALNLDPGLASTVPPTSATTTSAASSASKVASAATKIGIKTETVPPPADEVLAHPFKPLYRMLITLLQSSQIDVEVALNCREQVYESGILRFVLVDLIAVCDYMPKDPSHPAFQSVVELRKLHSTRMRAESRAKEANKTASGPAKGTGFGSDAETPLEPFDPSVGFNSTGSNGSSWTPEAYLKEQTAISKKVALLLECVHTYLEVVIEDHTSSSNYAQNREKRGLKRPTAARTASNGNTASFAGHLPEFDDSDRASTIPDNGSTRGLVGSSATSSSVPISASELSLHAPSRTSSNKSGRVPYHSLSTSHTDDYEDQDEENSDNDSSSVSSDASSSSGDSDSDSASSKSSRASSDRSDASSASDSDESDSSVDSLSSHEFFGTMDDYDADNNESPRRVSRDFRDRKEWRRSFSARRRISRDGSSMRGSTMAYEGSDRNMGSYGLEEERQEAVEEFWDEILDETALIVQPRLSEGAYKLICASNLVSVLESHLRNDTLLDMVPHMEAYESVLRVTNSMLVHEPLLPLIIPTDTTHHIFFLLGKLAAMSDHILKRMLQSFLSSSAEEKSSHPNSARNHPFSQHQHSRNHHGNHSYASPAYHHPHGLSSTPSNQYGSSNTPYSLGSRGGGGGGGSWLNDEGPLSSSPAFASHSLSNKHRLSARIQSSHANRHSRHSSSHPRLNVYTPGGHSVQYNMRPQANLYVTDDGHVFLRGGLEIDNEIRLALELRKTWKFAVFFVETYREKQFSEASVAPGMDGASENDFSNASSQAQHAPGGPSEDGSLVPQEVDESKVYERDSTRYTEAMQDHVFAEVDFFDSERGEYRHHYRNMAKTEVNMNPKKVRALVREVTALASSLPFYLESSVFLRIDETRMDVMKCIITGPEGTPYANGVFVFDLFCPAEFPSVPPLVNLQTTGSGTVRFNPNLYNCGKVCLSLLGTWRGGPNEQWNEATTTLLQVFVSIQSLIFVDQPFFNEPGYEALFNTTKGELQSAAYNDTIRLATITWAMVDVLKNLPFGFEQVTRLHFALKSRRIMKQTLGWLKDAAVHAHVSPDYFQKLKEIVIELQMLLLQLEPNAMEGLEDPASMHPALPPNIENENDASPSAPSTISTATSSANVEASEGATQVVPTFHEAPIGEDDSYFHPSDIYPHLANKKISAPKQ